jgi:hypothetical protein
MNNVTFPGSILTLIFFLFVLVIIWLIIRELVCWYYKINERITLQKRTNELLEQLLNKNSISSTPSLSANKTTGVLTGDLKVFTDEKKEHGFICSEKDLSNGAMWPAAKDLCSKYDEGGFNTWRLPNKDELSLMYEKFYKNGIGGFNSGAYWTSIEFGIYDAWQQDFSNGKQTQEGKSSSNLVRAVRSF